MSKKVSVKPILELRAAGILMRKIESERVIKFFMGLSEHLWVNFRGQKRGRDKFFENNRG